MADELSVHVNDDKHDALARVMLIYKKSMLHPRAHPQAVLEALQDVTAAVARHDGQWRGHDLLALLKATDMGKVVNGLRKYPSRRVAALATQVFHAWKLTRIGNNVLGSTLEYTSLAPPPADHDPDCPPSPHVYVIVDGGGDDAADDVLVTPSSVVATSKILKQVAASATSPSPMICQSALAKSTLGSSDDITSHSHVACRAAPAPADAPVVARKRSFNDANITCSTASYQAKLEASRRKLHAGYEREQAAKRLHTICLVRQDNAAPSKSPAAAGTHAISTSRRGLHDHVRKASSVAVPAPQRPIKSWHGAAVVRAH